MTYIIVANNAGNKLLEVAKQEGAIIYRTTKETDKKLLCNDVPKTKEISKLLINLGIKPNLKGFDYLKYAFENKLDTKKGITKVIYPIIAQAFDTTPSRVERALRHAIESAAYDDPKIYTELINICGKFDANPTNKQFLEGIKLYLEEAEI